MARSLCSRWRQKIVSRTLWAVLAALGSSLWLPASTPPILRRPWLGCLAASLPAEAQAQVNVGLRSLARRSRPRPETGVRMSDLGVMEGAQDADGARLVAAEVLSSSDTRVTALRCEFPHTLAGDLSGGAYAFLQVIPGVNGTATTEQILDAVLSSKGKFGAYGEPADVRVIQDKELAGGDRQLVLLFTSYSPQSAEFQNRAIVRSTTVDGDAFVLVGAAFDERWQKEPQVPFARTRPKRRGGILDVFLVLARAVQHMEAQRGRLGVSERDLTLKLSEWFCNGMPAEPLWQLSCEGPVLSTVYAQEAKSLVTLTAWQLQSWDLESKLPRCGLRGEGCWQALTYARHLRSVAAGARDGTVTVWDVTSGAAMRELSCGSAVACIDYAEAIKAVVTGEENGTIILWDLTRGLQLAVLWCKATVHTIAYWFIAPYIRDIPQLNNGEIMPKLIPASENGTMGRAVVTGDSAFKVTVWDIETSKARKTFGCSSNVLAIAVSPFLGLVAAGEANGRVTLWDVEIECALHRYEGGAVSALAFVSLSLEEQTLVSAECYRVVSWDMDTGQFQSRNLKLPTSCIAARCICFMPPSAGEDAAEAVVLVGDSSGRLAAWPWQRLQPLRGHDAKRCGDGFRVRRVISLASLRHSRRRDGMLPLKPQPEGGGASQRALQHGPIANRHCTDVPCCCLFLGHAAFFWFLVSQGFQQGHVQQLYLPRDFRGAFCGLSDGGPSVGASVVAFPKLSFTMSPSETFDKMALEMLCSAGRDMLDPPELAQYCDGGSSFSVASDALGALQSSLADPSKALSQLAGNGIFPTPTTVLSQATSYLTPVCTSSCQASTNRTFSYSAPPGASWAAAWQRFAASGAAAGIRLEFPAWSSEQCPYDARYCVPFPGVSLEEGLDDICLPALDSALVSEVGQALTQQLDALASLNVTQGVLQDVQQSAGSLMVTWDAFGVVAFGALVFGVLYLTLVRFFAKPVVWISVFLIWVGFIAAGVLAVLYALKCQEAGLLEPAKQGVADVASTLNITVTDIAGLSNSSSSGGCEDLGGYVLQNQTLRSVLQVVGSFGRSTSEPSKKKPRGAEAQRSNRGYTLLGFAAVWLLLVVCLRKRIQLAIAVNEVSAKFVVHHPQMICVPLCQFLLVVAWLAVWVICTALIVVGVPADYVPDQAYATELEAAGNATTPGACTNMVPPGFVYEDVATCVPDNVTSVPLCWRCAAPRYTMGWQFWYALFALLWHKALLDAVCQCLIAGAAGAWFFARHEEKASTFVFCPAFTNAVFWHLGSLAFGSLILAIVQWLKWFMRFLSEQAKASKNRVLQLIFCILACCIWCFEKLIKFLNKNAYIQIALKGTNFCTSARKAFELILRNIIRFGALSMLGALIRGVGTAFTCTATAITGYFVMQAFYPEISPILNILTYVLLGFVTGRLFLNLNSLSCDTIMQCYIISEEAEMKDRSEFVPAELKALMKDQDLKHSADHGSCCLPCC
ncbi:slc44a4 [Symbiodinium microadriaticum]|nr:slc44a4 [Symbiodinium microadriaticum]CAE7855165.1 slc44a4 [Symbiodinium sp. KB8]